MSRVRLSAHGCLELHPCFARLDALVPRVAKLYVIDTFAVSEPGTAATATTRFAGFLDSTAFGAYHDGHCRNRWCYMREFGQSETRMT